MTSLSSVLAALAASGATASSPDDLLGDAFPVIAELTGAGVVALVRRRTDGLHAMAGHGAPLEESDLLEEPYPALVQATEPGDTVDVPTPASWSRLGVTRVLARRLPDDDGMLLMGFARESRPEPSPGEAAMWAVLESGVARLVAETRLSDLRRRVDDAQRLANMGDYDWHIATDTNIWSNQLYRIYGHEPQSFNPSYERFLSLIHPDDRERIQGIHQQAYATGEPYEMIERIVRPDGEVRYLASNGQVLMDSEGVPARMRGTCIDITDRVMAEQSRERTAARFRSLVEASPDSILVVDPDGLVVQANERASELLGGDPVGSTFADLVPDEREPGRALGTKAIGLDGRSLEIDMEAADLDGDNVGHVAVFLHTADTRLAGEATAAGLREAQVRRRQAMEINDNVVQGLTAAQLALSRADLGTARGYVRRTLRSARQMMDDLLDPLDGVDLQPGDLVRSRPSTLAPAPEEDGTAEPASAPRGPVRILLVDDSEDVRALLRLSLTDHPGCEVVGEAGDGEQAVRLAGELQPDLVLLDLAMPTMDGLQALPLLRAEAPRSQVVVLSGFDQATLADKAIAAGAARYLEKGAAVLDLRRVIDEVTARS